MEERIIACTCGRRVRVLLGATEERKPCPQCGAMVRIPASAVSPQPVSNVEPSAVADATAQSEIALFFDEDQGSPSPESADGQPAETAQAMATEPKPKAYDTICARCGREFRGDWDKVDTDAGYMCHICANLAHDMPTKRPTASPVPPPDESVVRQAMQWSSWKALDAQNQKAQAEHKEDTRRFEMAVFAVIVVVTFVVLHFVIAGRNPEAEPAAEVPTQLPNAVVLLVHILSAIMELAAYSTAVYLTLKEAGRLPSGSRRDDLLTALGGGILTWGALFVAGFVPFPFVGVFAVTFVFYFHYHLDFGECLYFFLYMGLCWLLFWALRALIFGAIGMSLA